MKLYAGLIDLDNKKYEINAIDAEMVDDFVYKVSTPVKISYSTELSKISSRYCHLTLCIGKSKEDRQYVYYSQFKDKVIESMINFVNKNSKNNITINDIIIKE